jgi:hypothetical protein
MPEPLPRRSHWVHLPGSSLVSSAFPTLMSGRLPASFRERDFSRGKFSKLQLFRYVQASELACLPDPSYRCRFPRRAAEAFTSEQNVRRCLRTHRICSPPDYRQLAARGLSPREIHSIVDCSISISPHTARFCLSAWTSAVLERARRKDGDAGGACGRGRWRRKTADGVMGKC